MMSNDERHGGEEHADHFEERTFTTPRARRIWEELFADTLSPQEAAEILGVDKSTVMRWLREKTLIGFQMGRTWRVKEEDLRSYIEGQIQREREAARVIGIEHQVAEHWQRLQFRPDHEQWLLVICSDCGRRTALLTEHWDVDGDPDIWYDGYCRVCNTRNVVSGRETPHQQSRQEIEEPDVPEFENMPF